MIFLCEIVGIPAELSVKVKYQRVKRIKAIDRIEEKYCDTSIRDNKAL